MLALHIFKFDLCNTKQRRVGDPAISAMSAPLMEVGQVVWVTGTLTHFPVLERHATLWSEYKGIQPEQW